MNNEISLLPEVKTFDEITEERLTTVSLEIDISHEFDCFPGKIQRPNELILTVESPQYGCTFAGWLTKINTENIKYFADFGAKQYVSGIKGKNISEEVIFCGINFRLQCIEFKKYNAQPNQNN